MHQRFALAQKAAQAGIDKTRLALRASLQLGRLHGLVEQSVGRVGRFFSNQERERGAQERVHHRRWRLGRERIAQGLGTAQVAQDGKAQSLHTRMQMRGRLRVGQGPRATLADGHERDRERLHQSGQILPTRCGRGNRCIRRSQKEEPKSIVFTMFLIAAQAGFMAIICIIAL